MNLFSYISHNIDRIKYDVNIGLIPCTLIKHYQIYARFDYYLHMGYGRCQSIFFTSEDFKLSERSVFLVIKKMESDV